MPAIVDPQVMTPRRSAAMRTRLALACALAALLSSCESPPSTAPDAAVTDASALLVYPREIPSCAAPDEAPLRTGTSVDGVVCTRVGAQAPATPTEWPPDEALPAPLRYVDPEAAAGGDGTRAAPHRTLSEALSASPLARTLVLRRGTYDVSSEHSIMRSVTLVGAGVGATVLAVARGHGALVFGPEIDASLRGITVRYADSAPAGDLDVALRTDRTRLELTDVAVEGASAALSLTAGTLSAARFTARGSARYGVQLTGAARAIIDSFLLRDGSGQGLRADGARVFLSRGLIADNARHGIALLGTVTALTGFARCDDSTGHGSLDCIDQVVAQRNGVAGLYAQDARTVLARRITVSDTRLASVPEGMAGDGVVATTGATLSLDPDVREVSRRGFGSLVSGSARVGVLAQGEGTSVSVRGAWVTGNATGGIFLTGGAQATMVGESLFVANRFGGVVVTPGSVATIVQCNGIAETREGVAMTATGAITLADGVHLNGAGGDTGLVANVITQNGGFGVLVNASRATLLRNQGEDNRYGIAGYAGAVVVGNVGEVGGRERAPATAPALVGALR